MKSFREHLGLPFSAAFSSQFLTECVNVILPAGRTAELHSPPTLWSAGELSHCPWKQRASGEARHKGRTWGKHNPQLEAPEEGSASCLLGPLLPGQLKGWKWKLLRAALYQLKPHVTGFSSWRPKHRNGKLWKLTFIFKVHLELG